MNLRTATETLAGEFSLSRPDAQRILGDMVLEGLLAHGFAREKDGRYAVSERGERMLGDGAGA